MFQIDSGKCTRCGSCVSVCPQQAITMHDGMAAINQELCVQCGACVEVCPVGAIHGIVPAYAKAAKGGDKMPFGLAGRAHVSSYGCPYTSYYPYSYPYTGLPYPVRYGGRGRGRGRRRGFSWRCFMPYEYTWW